MCAGSTPPCATATSPPQRTRTPANASNFAALDFKNDMDFKGNSLLLSGRFKLSPCLIGRSTNEFVLHRARAVTRFQHETKRVRDTYSCGFHCKIRFVRRQHFSRDCG